MAAASFNYAVSEQKQLYGGTAMLAELHLGVGADQVIN